MDRSTGDKRCIISTKQHKIPETPFKIIFNLKSKFGIDEVYGNKFIVPFEKNVREQKAANTITVSNTYCHI